MNKQDLKLNKVFDKQYLIKDHIGSGSYGQVYTAYNLENQNMIVLKIEDLDSSCPVLKKEAAILRKLNQE